MITQVDLIKSHNHTFHGSTTYTSNILNKDNHIGFTNTGGGGGHSHSVYLGAMSTGGSDTDKGFAWYGGAYAWITSGTTSGVGDHTHNMEHVHALTPNGYNDATGGVENRPSNYTMKIWKRTA